jgi:hypothetical protein
MRNFNLPINTVAGEERAGVKAGFKPKFNCLSEFSNSLFDPSTSFYNTHPSK